MSSTITDQEYPRGPQEKIWSFILQKELKINGKDDNGRLEASSNHFPVPLWFGVNQKTASQQGGCLRGHTDSYTESLVIRRQSAQDVVPFIADSLFGS